MATTSEIIQIPIRARLETTEDISNYSLFSTSLIAETPYIQSININKSRAQFSTFNASVKIKQNKIDDIKRYIVIYMGMKLNQASVIPKIFTGYVRKTTINPCWDDPSYVIINIMGSDVLQELEGKKINRRQTKSFNSWVKIDGVISQGLKTGKFQFTSEPTIIISPAVPDMFGNNTSSSNPMNNINVPQAPVPIKEEKRTAAINFSYENIGIS